MPILPGDKDDVRSSYYSNYEQSEQYQIDDALFREWQGRIEQGEILGETPGFDQSRQDLYNSAAGRLNANTEYKKIVEKRDQLDRWRVDLNFSLSEKTEPLPQKMLEESKVDAVFEKLFSSQQPHISEIDSFPEFQKPFTAEVIIGGYRNATAKVTGWDSAMGYMHGLAGAQGAYNNRSDDYKISWNLANSAMSKLVSATEKVVETAPPFMPGRGPTPSLELANVGAAIPKAAITAPKGPIYFSKTEGNESSSSNDKGSGKAPIGGAYKDVPANGGEVHHMPADSVSPYSKGKGPGVRMEKEDHMKTKSWGSSKKAKAYRAKQEELIKEGKFEEAQQMDINDVNTKFGNRYNEGIKQMEDYTEELLK